MIGMAIGSCNSFYFYIKPQRFRIPESRLESCNSFYFYIKPQLSATYTFTPGSCNSFYFYIKPQPKLQSARYVLVVIHSISTSNHNLGDDRTD